MNDCVFCKVVSGDLPGKFAYQDDYVVVIHDISPRAPVHLLVLPRVHIPSLREVEEKHLELLGKLLLAAQMTAKKTEIAKTGYKLVVNNGKASGQIVDHLHIHVLGGWKEKQSWGV